MTLKVGMLLFPELTQLDLTGPYEVFSHVPGAEVYLVWKTMDPVHADTGLGVLPTHTFETCPDLDILCVPGGGEGQIALMEDEEVLEFLRSQAKNCQYITSVCTGSLVLGAAGLLQGYKATTHWAATECLAGYGAEFAKGRVVVDRDRITGGGVTAGIDFALTVVAKMFGEKLAKMIQLGIEYNPAPPFEAGHPDKADVDIVRAVAASMKEKMDIRRVQASRA